MDDMHHDTPLFVEPEEFRRLSTQVVDLLTEYLHSLDSREVFPDVTGAQSEEAFSTPLPLSGARENAFSELRNVLRFVRVQNGRFFGYVMGNGDPIASIGDFFASIVNQNMTAWRASPAGITIERTVVRWLAQMIGCSEFSGTLTGGSSIANLMAMGMAREAKFKGVTNETGLWAAQTIGTVYASHQVHMSIAKAVSLLGIGTQNLRLIACDENLRMIPDELEKAMQADLQDGKVPIAVVASAGTVATGSIDPFEDVSRIARKYDCWFHIDGAYGAIAAFAAPEKFRGIELADSVSLDPHKWLYQPVDIGCLLYRNRDSARRAFCNSGAYTSPLEQGAIEKFAYFEESIELSRRCRGLKLWLSLRYFGADAFKLSIKNDLLRAQQLAAAIDEHKQVLERFPHVELSALCFRHIGNADASEKERDAFNLQVLQKVIRRGKIYISNAELSGKFWLRACFVNSMTVEGDISITVSEVLETAKSILSEQQQQKFK